MKKMRHAGHQTRELVAVAAQYRRQVRIHDRGIAARHQFHQGAHPVRHRHLRETDLAGNARRRHLVMDVAIAVQEDDGAGAEPVRESAPQLRPRAPPRPSSCIVSPWAPTRSAASMTRSYNISGSTMCRSNKRGRACVAILQRITKAAGDYQHGPLTLAFQQRVGGDGGAHFHAGHLLRRDLNAGPELQQPANALDRGILVVGGILRQQLKGVQRPVRRASDDVRERAAAIDPELPAAHDSAALSGMSTRPRVSGIANADTMTRAYAATVKPAMASPSAKRVLSTPINEGQNPPMPRPTL